MNGRVRLHHILKCIITDNSLLSSSFLASQLYVFKLMHCPLFLCLSSLLLKIDLGSLSLWTVTETLHSYKDFRTSSGRVSVNWKRRSQLQHFWFPQLVFQPSFQKTSLMLSKSKHCSCFSVNKVILRLFCSNAHIRLMTCQALKLLTYDAASWLCVFLQNWMKL